MSNRQENRYYELVAKKDNIYYVLDYTFKDSDSFKWSVWTLFEAITEEAYNEKFYDNSYFEEVWKDAVINDETRFWFEGYIDSLDYYEIENILFDTSYEWTSQYEDVMKISENEIWNIKRLNCVGGGRSLSRWDSFDIVYNQSLLDKALSFEENKKG